MTIVYGFAMFCTFIFEALIAHILFSTVFHKKEENHKYYLILFVGYVIYFALYSLDSMLINLSAFIAINLVLTIILYDAKFSTKICYVMFFTSFMCVTEVITLFILKIIFIDFTLNDEAKILLAIISKIMLFLLVKFFINIVIENTSRLPLNKFFALLSISITIVSVLYVFVSLTISIKIDIIMSMASLFSAIGLMSSIMLIFYLFEQSIKEQTDLKEFALLRQKSELDMKHYKILKENYDNVKIIEHDIKKHIRLIDEFAKISNNLEIVKYIEGFNEDMQYFSLKPISKNKALDIVLNEKMQIAQNKDMKFIFHIQNVNMEFIKDVDICTIFSNILDNALESCEKSENKEIILEIYIVNGKFLTIELTNSCDTVPVTQNGELVTSKINSNNHGFGMKSIIKTVKKYKGQVFYFYNEEELKFITNISIPV